MKQGINSTEMQKANRLLALRTLQEKGTMTRTELAKATGLQKATITNIVYGFGEMGILASEDGEITGRRGERIFLKLDDIYIISMEITRKEYQIAVFSMQGTVLETVRYDFAVGEQLDSVVEKMKFDAGRTFEKYPRERVIGACLSVPGLFIRLPDSGKEMFIVSEFEELSHIDIRAELEETLRMPIIMKHDSKLAAYAEWKYMKEEKADDHISLAVIRSRGYGIGTGIVIHGKTVEGCLGLAGEIGYTGIDYNGMKINKGNRGAFEYNAGIDSTLRYLKERLFEFPDSCLNEASNYQDILDGYRKGDELSIWIMNKLAWMLSYGITNLIYTINPDYIILGADYPDDEDFIGRIKKYVCENVPEQLWDYISIIPSTLKDNSFLIGGYYAVLDRLYKDGILEKLKEIAG